MQYSDLNDTTQRTNTTRNHEKNLNGMLFQSVTRTGGSEDKNPRNSIKNQWPSGY